MLKIALLGDLGLFGRYCIHDNPGCHEYLKSVSWWLKSHDVVVANLETPFVHGHKARGAKSAHICANPENVRLLQHLGVSHVNLANNHIADFGPNAYELTKETLRENGITYFGIESNAAYLAASGTKICFSGYCSYNTNPQFMTRSRRPGVNTLNVRDVLSKMHTAHQEGYFNIVSVHSGQEHVHLPSSEDVQFARALAAEMPYVYYGHHPHVVQGFERRNEAILLYSLGNFLFDDVYTPKSDKPLVTQSEANKTGLIASITMQGPRVSHYSLVPVYMDSTELLFGNQVPYFSPQPYNQWLDLAGTQYYDSVRSHLIGSLIKGRKRQRDFQWYWSRLSTSSLRLLRTTRANARLHKRHFSDPLLDLKYTSGV